MHSGTWLGRVDGFEMGTISLPTANMTPNSFLQATIEKNFVMNSWLIFAVST